jgi:hypothetical protein
VCSLIKAWVEAAAWGCSRLVVWSLVVRRTLSCRCSPQVTLRSLAHLLEPYSMFRSFGSSLVAITYYHGYVKGRDLTGVTRCYISAAATGGAHHAHAHARYAMCVTAKYNCNGCAACSACCCQRLLLPFTGGMPHVTQQLAAVPAFISAVQIQSCSALPPPMNHHRHYVDNHIVT